MADFGCHRVQGAPRPPGTGRGGARPVPPRVRFKDRDVEDTCVAELRSRGGATAVPPVVAAAQERRDSVELYGRWLGRTSPSLNSASCASSPPRASARSAILGILAAPQRLLDPGFVGVDEGREPMGHLFLIGLDVARTIEAMIATGSGEDRSPPGRHRSRCWQAAALCSAGLVGADRGPPGKRPPLPLRAHARGKATSAGTSLLAGVEGGWESGARAGAVAGTQPELCPPFRRRLPGLSTTGLLDDDGPPPRGARSAYRDERTTGVMDERLWRLSRARRSSPAPASSSSASQHVLPALRARARRTAPARVPRLLLIPTLCSSP